VELNPGPITSDKELNKAAVMKIFGSSAHHCMTIGAGLGVKTADLQQIPGAATNSLMMVFERWFDTDRDVNWDTLIKLCYDFPDQLGKAKSNLLKYIGLIQDTSVSDDPSLASHSASSLSTSAGDTPCDMPVTTPFESTASEEKVYESLDDLRLKFSDLVTLFETKFEEKSNHDKQLATDVSKWLIAHMDWEHGSVESNIDDILRKIRPYYDFIDCKLLLDMSKKFLQDVTFADDGVTYKLVDELHSHTLMSKSLCTSNTVSELKKFLQEHFKH
ncbi:PREDICTED: uncharacterized protein LOC109592513, partial [Amphimedon queenslandica]